MEKNCFNIGKLKWISFGQMGLLLVKSVGGIHIFIYALDIKPMFMQSEKLLE